ncbi:LLM class flavin-dependent oxidoreductase [Microbulbifer hydrolyticus]|uniref:Luciferase-like monooxygenase n=1 Tax=Microbulbifer hydrolyticus TaxID=48074 RepID=A0A6P1TDJ7_9GAMM|nr:LLM class flavin-dependent oxidoreductase [Microbulbifer hydrolyticus]MBB5212221.1 luciferase family oxidoreductase group 1 [Microbulbifer hydrolyticus]QHQ39881.1 MsnO8 family LLM class oxidoreductase [Microbulbifer hydrolyticus]
MRAYSLLDLSPITDTGSARQALQNSRDLAQHAEAQGYHRFWMAEHHNMAGVASAATAVALGYIAAGTEKIRVAAGGVMLPNHAPLVIAEQFGTLAALYPDRVDLGLGRAPGTDGATMTALRRDPLRAADQFPQDVRELLHYFAPEKPGQRVRAVPGVGLGVPIWLLGSSLYSAQLAAALGLPFAFASHFAPAMLDQALHLYREQFQPSEHLDTPYVAAAINVFAADSDEDGRKLMTSIEQQFVALRRGTPGPLKPPVADPATIASPSERAQVAQALAESAVGTAATIGPWIDHFLERTRVDELIVTGAIYDHRARLRSFELAAEVLRDRVDA